MTKNRIRLLTVALLALMLVLAVYFCLIAMPTAQAKADTEYVLSDVSYNIITSELETSPQIVFFKGYVGSPTVGSYFAYAMNSLETGYTLPTTWSTLKFNTSSLIHYNVETSPGHKPDFYLFTVSFDFLGSGYYSTIIIEDKTYKYLGYFNFRDSLQSYNYFEVRVLLDESTHIYYLQFLINNGTETLAFSSIENFTGYEGEFINLSFALPVTWDIGAFTVRMPFTRNFYSTTNFNSANGSATLPNQAFLNAFSFSCFVRNLYDFDNTFFEIAESQFGSYIFDAIDSSYNNGYNLGYSQGYTTAAAGINSISSVTWISSIFSSISRLFSIQIFGSITLATVIFIPIILAIVLFVLRLVRG